MVKWTDPARQDLKSIHEFIAHDSPFYAHRIATEIVEKSEMLSKFPTVGRVVPEIADENVREVFIYSYRLIYEIKRATIFVLALVHGKRDFAKHRTVRTRTLKE